MFVSIKYLFHLLPLAPLALGYYWFAGASLLVVASCYIKTLKLQGQLDHVPEDLQKSESLEKVRQTRDFWKKLTFL